MSKVEIINRLIMMDIIRENDRDFYMQMSQELLLKMYIKIVPIIVEKYLERKYNYM